MFVLCNNKYNGRMMCMFTVAFGMISVLTFMYLPYRFFTLHTVVLFLLRTSQSLIFVQSKGD